MTCPTRRHLLLLPVLLWALPAQADLLPSHPASRSTPVAGTGITPGTYLGHWSDGSALRNTLRVIGPDMITLQRLGYSSQPVPYLRIAQNLFRSDTGNVLAVLGPTRLRWTNTDGTSVIYDLE